MSFTVKDVELPLSQVPDTSSQSSDHIKGKNLHYGFKCLAPFVYMLFDVLTSCEWPKEWKCALVNPAHKSGSVRSVSNHRPISILPCLSLVLERVLFNHNDFKIRHKLRDCQHGFCRRRSTITQLLLFCDQLYVWRTIHVLTSVFQRLSIECLIISFLKVICIRLSPIFPQIIHILLG